MATVLVVVLVATAVPILEAGPASAQPTPEPKATTAERTAAPAPAPPPAREEIVDLRTRDAKHYRNADGTHTALFGHYLHYQSAPGRWDDVDLNLRADGADFVMDRHDLAVRVGASGVEASERATGKGIRWLTPTRPAVDGRRARVTDQGLDWEYATRISGIKLAAKVEGKRGQQTYEFRYALLGGAQALSVDADGGLRSDGFSVPRAFAIGSDNKTYPASAWRVLPGQRVAFDFDDGDLPSGALPYLLDPTTQFNVATGGDDGDAMGCCTGYPPPAFGVETGYPYTQTGKKYRGGNDYDIANSLMRWNTSSLPDDSTATSATLQVGVCDVRYDDWRYIVADWYAAWPIDVWDYSPNPQTSALATGKPIWQLAQTQDAWGCRVGTAAGAQNTIPLANANGVSLTGHTGLRLHVNGGAPAGSNYALFVALEHSVTAEPRLLVDYNRPPFGSIDEVSAANGRVRTRGWAIDPDTTAAIAVHVYVGAAGYAITANTYRPDVGAAYPGYGDYHGYDAWFTTATGTYDVCVYAINVPSGPNPSLGCRSVYVPPPDPPPAPTVSSSTHPSSNTWYASNDPQFSFSATDATHGINGYSWSYTASATTVPDDVADAASPVTLVDRAEGTGWFHVKARNGANPNLWGPTTHFQVNIDTTAPVAPAVSAEAPNVCNASTWAADNTPGFTWSASDISGINGYSYELNQTQAFTPDDTSEGVGTAYTSVARADGTWWFHVKARNGAGVWGATADCKVLIDAGSPAAPVPSSPSHPDPAKWYPSRTADFAWTPGTPAGASPVVAYAHDAPDQVALVRDPTSVSDGPGLTAPPYTVGGDGTWFFHVKAQNSAGTWGPSGNMAINVDVTPPEVPPLVLSLTHPAGVGVSNRSATATWTPGSDATSGVAGYSWSFNQDQALEDNGTKDGDALTLSATSASLPDGVSWFHVKTIDNAGNASADKVYGPIVVDPNGPLGLSLTLLSVAEAASDELGLEQFYPYARHDLGTADGYVHLRTGNLVVQHDDVAVPSQGLNVVVRRTYNSQQTTDPDGMGRGWRLSVSDLEAGIEGVDGAVEALDASGLVVADLVEVVAGVATVTGQLVEFTDGDGTTHRFVRKGGPGTRWDSPPGVSLRLREVTDGSGAVVAFELIRPDGVVYRAENVKGLLGLATTAWRVTSVTDRSANRLTYEYEAVAAGVGTKVRLVRIKHSRTADAVIVRFSYDAAAALVSVISLPGLSAPDPATGAPRSWERRTDLAYTAGRLSSVTEAAHADVASGQRTTGFSYHPITGLLETVADADGKLTSFGYSSELGAQLLTTLTDRRAKAWGYAYGAADLAGARTTTATPPVGGATTYAVSGRGPVSDADRRVAGGNIATITDAGTDAGAVVSVLSWAQNRLTATTDGAGATTSYTYNDVGLVETITQPAPNAPGTAGLPAGAPTVPVTSVLTYRFAAPWRYPGCTAPAPGPGPVSTDGYCEAVADLAQVRVADSAGASRRVSDFAYDADTGHLITVTERANGSGAPTGADRATAFVYYARGGLRSIDGPRTDEADVTTFGDTADATYGGYDRTGMPLRLTDALGKTKTLAYTPYGLVANLVDRDEAVTTSRYDERDNLIEAKDAAGAVTRFAYDANDAKVTETSPRGTATATVDDHTTMWCHDATGLVVKVSEPGASGAAPASDPCADVATRLADRTEALTAYRADGTKSSETNPAGAVVDFEYYPNASLKLTRADTAPGVARAETLHLYDAAGRVRLTRGPVANAAGQRPETEWSFTPDGQVATEAATTAVTDAGGAVRSLVTHAYNAHGEALEATGPRQVEGTRQRQASLYNAFGEVTESRRLLKAPGQAARDVVSRFGYDAAGHQTSASQPTGTGAELTSTFAFDAIGQLAAQTSDPLNPGHTVEYAYTAEGQQRSRVDKANGAAWRTAVYTYNLDNTQASLVFTDNATGATLASCNFAAGEPPASGFDPDGNLLVSRTVAGTTGCAGGTTTRTQTFTYDGRDFLTATTQKVRAPAGAEISRTQSFTYDPGGARASATHAGKNTTYGHSPAGWLLSMADWRGKASAVSYLPSGAPTTHAVGGAAKTTMAYHRDGSLAELSWRKDSAADPALVRSHTAVAYDTGGLRRAETVQVAQPVGEITGASGPGTAATDHDSLDRLVRWVSPFAEPGTAAQPATAYSLDDGGNIESEAKTAGATSWNVDPSYDHGRLASRTSTGPEPTTNDVFSYTGLGEESSRTTTTAGLIPTTATTATTYDPAGHTARVDRPGAAPDVDYVYDTADRLLARTEGLETTLYFYWGAGGTIAEETDATGATKARYLVDDDDEVTAVERYEVPGAPEATARWTWQLSDLAGNAATFVDDAGVVVEQAAFDPYGKTERGGSGTDLVGGAKPTLGFQGAMTDKATGSVMLGARLYDPTTARFTTPDTYVAAALDVGLGTDELTANRYLFAGANPVAFYEDGHGLFGLKAPKLPSPIKALKAVAKKAMPVLQFVPVVSTGIDVVSAATGRDLANGGRKLSGAERAMLLGTAALGAVPGAGSAAKAGLKVTAKLTRAKSATKAINALARHAPNTARAVAGPPNRINSARVLIREAEESGPFHNFPGSFDDAIYNKGTRTVTPDFFNKPRTLMRNDSIQYRLPGSINGRSGTYEIFTRPSLSGRTEVVQHRFFRPNKR